MKVHKPRENNLKSSRDAHFCKMFQPPCLVLLHGTARVTQLAPLIFVAERLPTFSVPFPTLDFLWV